MKLGCVFWQRATGRSEACPRLGTTTLEPLQGTPRFPRKATAELSLPVRSPCELAQCVTEEQRDEADKQDPEFRRFKPAVIPTDDSLNLALPDQTLHAAFLHPEKQG